MTVKHRKEKVIWQSWNGHSDALVLLTAQGGHHNRAESGNEYLMQLHGKLAAV